MAVQHPVFVTTNICALGYRGFLESVVLAGAFIPTAFAEPRTSMAGVARIQDVDGNALAPHRAENKRFLVDEPVYFITILLDVAV